MNGFNADPTGRATFFEGQIVSSSDLNQVVEQARATAARHERYLHLPGIAEGLELSGEDRQTDGGQPYVEITVASGLAVDGTGRHLIVPEPNRLSEDKFDQLNVAINDTEAFYPVFALGMDVTPDASDAPLILCGTTAPTRVIEIAEITFGRVEDAADPGNMPVEDVTDGPGGASSEPTWRVLIGFVKWDASIARFTAVKDSHDGIGRLNAGVKADEVVARGGVLALRSAAKDVDGAPAVEIDGSADGELRFGPQNSAGVIAPVFTVNAKGDLHAAGKITGAIATGAQILTGSVSDCAKIPLPAGLTQTQIDAGEVSIQVTVTPRYGRPALSAPAGDTWFMRPLECRVEGRRVFCRNRWERLDASSAVQETLTLPGVADFTLVALGAE